MGIYSFKLNNLKNRTPCPQLFCQHPSQARLLQRADSLGDLSRNLESIYHPDVFLVHVFQSDISINTVVKKIHSRIICLLPEPMKHWTDLGTDVGQTQPGADSDPNQYNLLILRFDFS
jgi:hypothetical protein